MKSFSKLYKRAAARKGGEAALEALIVKPKSKAALARIPDDRWLSAIARSVFRAGFNWKVVDNKWPDIEAAYDGFDPHGVAFQSDDDLDMLVKDPRVIRQWRKLKAIRANAQYVVDLAKEHGSAARYFANFPSTKYIDLLDDMKKRGSHLGGTSAQYFLREIGKDSFILSRDVTAALKREKVFDGTPTSKSSLRQIQDTFNEWVDDGGKSLTRVSRVLAFTVG
ncbi:MAG: 3-methyladenine DNA glycosylase [Gammaproteobacteria bacterium]|nr:3-methyladenine DNA glycosylase [Gammaproteobacteria bacterium]